MLISLVSLSDWLSTDFGVTYCMLKLITSTKICKIRGRGFYLILVQAAESNPLLTLLSKTTHIVSLVLFYWQAMDIKIKVYYQYVEKITL